MVLSRMSNTLWYECHWISAGWEGQENSCLIHTSGSEMQTMLRGSFFFPCCCLLSLQDYLLAYVLSYNMFYIFPGKSKQHGVALWLWWKLHVFDTSTWSKGTNASLQLCCQALQDAPPWQHGGVDSVFQQQEITVSPSSSLSCNIMW